MADQHEQHDHHAHQHEHGVSRDADKRFITMALILLLAFMVAEVVIGIIASSLALISDAGHMLTDAGALILALVTIRLAERPPGGQLTFGLKRTEILSAQANGITLLLLSAWFIYEAGWRLVYPPPVRGLLVMWVALVGIAVNLLATWSISHANRQSLNVEDSFQHILTDLYAFIATALAGGLIVWTGYNRLDALAALFVAALMLRAGFKLVTAAGRVFLEAAPRHLDPEHIGRALAADQDVAEVHDLHIWEVTSEFPALSAHVLVRGPHACPGGDCHAVRWRLEQLLEERFDIHHTTLQVDHLSSAARISAESLRSTLPTHGAKGA